MTLTLVPPLVGLPFTVKQWSCTVAIICNCEAKESVIIAGGFGAVGVCPSCHRAFILKALQGAPPVGMNVTLDIGVATPQEKN